MSERGDQHGHGRAGVAALVMALGLAASVLAFVLLECNARRTDMMHFAQLTERLTSEVRRREQLYEYGLRGAAATFAASERVTRDEFRRMVESQQVTFDFPGVLGVGYIERVPREKLEEFVASTRTDGAPNFSVDTSGNESELLVVTYMEPSEGNAGVLGYDLAQEPRRREAALSAIRSGSITLSEPVQLVHDADGSKGFWVFKPLYASAVTPATPEAREAQSRGLIYMRLRAAEMFEGISDLAGHEMRFAVFGGEHARESELVYQDGGEWTSAGEAWYLGDAPLRAVEQISVAGQRWTIVARESEGFLYDSRSLAWVTLAMGIVVSGLLGWTIGSTTRRMITAQEIVKEQQAALESTRAETEMLALVAERTSNAVVITDAQQRITWVNEGFTRVTGYTLDEVKGKVPGRILQFDKTDAQTVRRMGEELRAGRPFRGTILNKGKDGRQYWLAIEIQPLRDEAGVVTGFIAVESDITEEKQRQREMEAAYAALEEAESIGRIGNWEYSVEHGTLRWSKQIFRLFGRELACGEPGLEEALRDYSDVDVRRLRAAFARTVETGEPFLLTMRTRHGYGGVRFVRANGQARRDDQGKIVAVFGTAMDVTAEVEREESLRQVQERWTFAVEGSGDGVWDWNIATGDVVFSARYQEMLGYTDGDLSGKFDDWASRVLPEDLDEARRRLEAHFECRTPSYSIELRMRCKDGSLKWILARGMVVRRDEHGRPLRMVGTHTDISERKHAELTLRETTSYLDVYKKIVDHHAIVAETDVRGTIVHVNEAFCRISGYTREELIGQNHRILNSGVHPKAMWTEMYRTVASGGFWHGEVCNKAKDGTLYWVDTTIAPLHDDAGKVRGYFAIRADITGLKTARALAEAANRSKSEFLANMSHEIRTPMTAILGYAELLADDPTRPLTASQRSEYVETIKRNGDHLLAIISDILDISKIEAGKMTVEAVQTNPSHIVQDVVSLMSVKARGKGISLETSAETAIPRTIRTDPVRLRQVLMNLLGNAIKFTESGGVTLHMAMVEPKDADGSPKLRFEISDTGIGIAPEHQRRLFGAFVQADTSMTRRFGGTGLGLQISKRLAEMLGGDISLTSSPGKGSTFCVTIGTGPLEGVEMMEAGRVAEVVHERANKPTAGPTAKPLEGVRVLLAEDGPDNQRLISFHLRKAGADVRIVENGLLMVEALTLDGTRDGELWRPSPVDVVLTDMQMPEMDGYQATRLLREKGCELPIVALTAHAMAGDAERCLAAGCDAYTTKPIDKAKLIETCRAAATGELRQGRKAA